MNLQEVAQELGKSEKTIKNAFARTQQNLIKKGIILTKTGRHPNVDYQIEYQEILPNSYIVYIHINKINHKAYVGITKRSLEERTKKDGKGYCHQTKFWNAIQKYGWENFEHIILYDNLTQEEANELEQKLIAEYDSINNGYNVLKGGSYHSNTTTYKSNSNWLGKKHSQEYKERMSNLMKEKWQNPEYVEQVKQNMKKNHAICTGQYNAQSKPVYCVEKKLIKFSCGDMAEALGFDRVQGAKSIARVCRKERTSYKKLHFTWATKEQIEILKKEIIN